KEPDKSKKYHQNRKTEKNLKKASDVQDTIKAAIGNVNISRVPIGYGRMRSQDGLTSAVGVVRAEDLPVRSSITNPLNLLYGKVLGLTALTNPNRGRVPTVDLFIRGRETFNY